MTILLSAYDLMNYEDAVADYVASIDITDNTIIEVITQLFSDETYVGSWVRVQLPGLIALDGPVYDVRYLFYDPNWECKSFMGSYSLLQYVTELLRLDFIHQERYVLRKDGRYEQQTSGTLDMSYYKKDTGA